MTEDVYADFWKGKHKFNYVTIQKSHRSLTRRIKRSLESLRMKQRGFLLENS